MKSVWIALLAVLVLTVPAWAQQPATISVTAFAATAADPATATPAAAAVAFTMTGLPCDLAPIAEDQNTTNPTRYRFNDPLRQGRQCEAPTAAILTLLQAGSFRLASRFTYPAPVGLHPAWSNLSASFTRWLPAPPAGGQVNQ